MIAGFREALQSVWSSPEAERQIAEAYGRYSATLWQAWQTSEVSKYVSETYAEYIHKVKETIASDEEWARVNKAFRQYAEDLKKAWISVDPEAITLEEMAAIAVGMLWVTGVVGVVHRARDLKP